jgi:hypothetical protein
MEVGLAREPFQIYQVFLSAFKLQLHYGTSDVEVGLTDKIQEAGNQIRNIQCVSKYEEGVSSAQILDEFITTS